MELWWPRRSWRFHPPLDLRRPDHSQHEHHHHQQFSRKRRRPVDHGHLPRRRPERARVQERPDRGQHDPDRKRPRHPVRARGRRARGQQRAPPAARRGREDAAFPSAPRQPERGNRRQHPVRGGDELDIRLLDRRARIARAAMAGPLLAGPLRQRARRSAPRDAGHRRAAGGSGRHHRGHGRGPRHDAAGPDRVRAGRLHRGGARIGVQSLELSVRRHEHLGDGRPGQHRRGLGHLGFRRRVRRGRPDHGSPLRRERNLSGDGRRPAGGRARAVAGAHDRGGIAGRPTRRLRRRLRRRDGDGRAQVRRVCGAGGQRARRQGGRSQRRQHHL